MSLDINLIRQTKLFSPKWEKIHKITRNVSYVVMALFILLAVAVFLGRMYIGSRVISLNAAIEAAKKQIEQQKATEGIYLSLARKLGRITEITKDRLNPGVHYEYYAGVFAEYGRILQISVTGGQTILQAEIYNVNQIDNLIRELLENPTVSVKSVTMTGLDKAEPYYVAEFMITY